MLSLFSTFLGKRLALPKPSPWPGAAALGHHYTVASFFMTGFDHHGIQPSFPIFCSMHLMASGSHPCGHWWRPPLWLTGVWGTTRCRWVRTWCWITRFWYCSVRTWWYAVQTADHAISLFLLYFFSPFISSLYGLVTFFCIFFLLVQSGFFVFSFVGSGFLLRVTIPFVHSHLLL